MSCVDIVHPLLTRISTYARLASEWTAVCTLAVTVSDTLNGTV
jgi:hypothetical protein